ncbi:MAG: YgiQ family radical SAM protein [Kiritimatiellia bacterium]
MYLPTTAAEIKRLGWPSLDVILVTGDTYVDSPFVGAAVIGKCLLQAGFRVGIIAQPQSEADFRRLGEPTLFWGVTSGCVDSLVANRTASGRRRQRDDFTPGGQNNRRPDRATIVYSSQIRSYFKKTVPIVLGGIEASLRRVAHYDFWSNKIRRSILFDAKADYLLYGMADTSVVALAQALRDRTDPTRLRGIGYISPHIPQDAVELPAFEEVATDKNAFTRMFHTFYANNDPLTARPLAQRQDTRYYVQQPPPFPLEGQDLDAMYEMDYERDVHPFYAAGGPVRALETIRFSITTHRGCYGECNFCAIAVHQGRRVCMRTEASILREARKLSSHPAFRGSIFDVGGPTANMYGIECTRKSESGSCRGKRCLYPELCPELPLDHGRQLHLLKALRQIPGIKRVIVASGIRHDLVMADSKNGRRYLDAVVRDHVSGQMKLAPEHTEPDVLTSMGKPGPAALKAFRSAFQESTRQAGKKQFLTYYLMAAHPGCTDAHMHKLKTFAAQQLAISPEQVQIFTPTPSTYSTLMYWTEQDPFTGKPCFVEKTAKGRVRQKEILQA